MLRAQGVLVEAKAGDLILWDSRLIHGGLVGPGPTAQDETTEATPAPAEELVRLAFTVCMTPKDLADPRVLKHRRKAFQTGRALTHWPHEFHSQGLGSGSSTFKYTYQPPELSKEQEDLID